jgi:hypothetical protein
MRRNAFLIHLVASVVLVGGSALFVLHFWYPHPLAELQGVRSIIILLAGVDLALGPLCTLIVANPKKPVSELRRDVLLIASIQSLALVYGLYTAFAARPAFVVYNADRFDIVTASELAPERLAEAQQEEFRRVPWYGVVYAYAVRPSTEEERLALTISAALGGADVKDFPRFYRPWGDRDPSIVSRLRPLSDLHRTNPDRNHEIDELLMRVSISGDDVAYFPLIGRAHKGAVILRRDTLEILAPTTFVPAY